MQHANMCVILWSSGYLTNHCHRLLFCKVFCTCDLGFLTCLQVDREFRVQKALYSVGFPVPQPLLHCTDAEVIGTEFYIMEHVKAGFFKSDICSCSSTSPLCSDILYVGSVSLKNAIQDKNRFSCSNRVVYFVTCVFLGWAQRRGRHCTWQQWKSWRDSTHWTCQHWTSKGLEKDQATAGDRWVQMSDSQWKSWGEKELFCPKRCPLGQSNTMPPRPETFLPWESCLIGWWRICQPRIVRSRLFMEIFDWTIWYFTRQR